MRSIARNPNGRGRFRCFAALMLLFVLPLQAGAQPSVVGYYEELRQSGAADDLTYALREEGKRWVTTSPDWGTPMPVTVDGPRGYMRILDDGTGGGSFETQVVLWRQADDLLGPKLPNQVTAALPPVAGITGRASELQLWAECDNWPVSHEGLGRAQTRPSLISQSSSQTPSRRS
jgi:hypothetical protein